MRTLVAVAALALLAGCGEKDAPPATSAPSSPAVDVSGPSALPTPEPTLAPGPTAVSSPDIAPSPSAIASAPPSPATVGAAPPAGDVLIGTLPRSNPDFMRFPAAYAQGAQYGHRQAVEAFIRMADAAKRDGLSLRVVSGFRSFADQKRIWEDKWTGRTLVNGARLDRTIPDPTMRALKILEYSSMPTTSRHHWGTDFDINSTSPATFNSGAGARVYQWLSAHAAEYGFCQPYSARGAERPNGYNEEKWHWSFKAIASANLARWPQEAGYGRISGFLGAETAQGIGIVEKYVQGVNPACKG
jgi:hypothetical protein